MAAFCHVGEDTPRVEALLVDGRPEELLHALSIASRLDDGLPDAVVERGLGGDEMLVRRTLYCLGMQGDDVRLKEVEADPSRPAWVSGGARWWREQGPRLAD